MHHDPDDQGGADQHDGEHREAGDGRRFPHIRCDLRIFTWGKNKHSFNLQHWQKVNQWMNQCWRSRLLTCVARRGLGVLLARRARHTLIQIWAPKIWDATLTCTHTHTHTHSRHKQLWHLWDFYWETRLGPGGFMTSSKTKPFSLFMPFSTLF